MTFRFADDARRPAPRGRSALRAVAAALAFVAGGLGSAASAQDAATPGAPPPQAQQVVTETHGDWEIVCVNGEAPCAMRQVGMTEGQPILEMTLTRIAARQTERGTVESVLNIGTPLSVLLNRGVSIQVDAGEPVTGLFTFCRPDRCLLSEPVPNALVDSFKRGAVAKVGFVLLQGDRAAQVEVDISLSGFTAAYNALPVQGG